MHPIAPVHILAPGRDGELSCRVLGGEGIECHRCRDAADLQQSLTEDSGAVVLAEEALDGPLADWLRSFIAAQAPWSDLPIVVVAQERRRAAPAELAAGFGNVMVLTRPMAVPDLISAIRSALRARQRQSQVRQLLAQQREESRRKDEFLAMLAHELRNPLSPVRHAAHVLRAESSSPRALRMTDVIERQVAHMGQIITKLLDVSRLTRGKIHLERAAVDLAELARRCVEARDETARNLGVSIELHAQGAAWVHGDEMRLDQVIENLLDNAVKFSSAGSRVIVQVDAREGWAQLEVRDDGEGIPLEELPYLFQPFVQADKSLDRARGGLGLGLALAKGLVELHGGRIEAHSKGLGHGSIFRISIPLTSAASPVPEFSLRDSALVARGRVRVLLAEDNVDAAEVLRMLLEGFGYRVTVAVSGTAAVEAACSERPDALLCDIGLPGMSGYEVARRLRAVPELAHILMIAITGYGTREDREAASAAGFDMHFAKPVDPMRLLAELQKLERVDDSANSGRMRSANAS